MRVIGPSSDDEMVLAFLRAEFYSPKLVGQCVRHWLRGDRGLVEDAHLDNAAENATRNRALAECRGYGSDAYLFRGFPTDANWLRVAYSVDEVGKMKYGKHEAWTTLSGGSRLVRDGAENVPVVQTAANVNSNVIDVQHRVARGERFPELILAAETEESVPIIVEGHTRATAYVRALPVEAEVEALLGVSEGLTRWVFA